jgi:ribosomal protein L11 methyltransferase
MQTTKLSVRTHELDLARSIVGLLEETLDPPPDAVTLFEDGPSAWRIEAYGAHLPDAAALAVSLEAAIGRPVPALVAEAVPDLNWVAVSQAALPPVVAGRFIVHGSHDRGRIPRGPGAILIDAGEAFGTAHHATTLGCLLAIDGLARRRRFRRVLDLGGGSGVLAIGVARAMRDAQVLASDSDPNAIEVASANAEANGARQIAFACAFGLAHPWLRHAGPFDLIIANILAGPLRALATAIGKSLRRGGYVVLSGILDPEAPTVVASYVAQGFALQEHRRIAGWSTLTFRKRL